MRDFTLQSTDNLDLNLVEVPEKIYRQAQKTPTLLVSIDIVGVSYKDTA